MNQRPAKPKIGQGSVQAAFRKGISELQAIVPAFPDSVKAPAEPGELWSITTQGASQQTGVSQPVSLSSSQTQGFEAMNPETPDVEIDPTLPDVTDSIVDNCIEQACDMAPGPELEQTIEVDP